MHGCSLSYDEDGRLTIGNQHGKNGETQNVMQTVQLNSTTISSTAKARFPLPELTAELTAELMGDRFPLPVNTAHQLV